MVRAETKSIDKNLEPAWLKSLYKRATVTTYLKYGQLRYVYYSLRFRVPRPQRLFRFAPKWNKEAFKAPFTAAEGWGTYSQEGARQHTHRFEVKYGALNLKTIGLEKASAGKIKRCTVTLGSETIPARFVQHQQDIRIELAKPVRIPGGGVLVVLLT